MFDPDVHVGACALILNPAHRLLMIQRSDDATHGAGTWCVPGGWVDSGEIPELTILRELEEEVGIKTNNAYLFDVVSNVYPDPINTVVTIFYEIPYTYDTMHSTIKEPSKIQDLRWVPVGEIRSLNLFPAMRTLIERKILR